MNAPFRQQGLAVLFCLGLAVAVGTPARADQAQAVAAVRQVSRVIDVKAEPGGNMYVLVKEEAVDWDKFASAVCTLIRPYQGRIFKVRVIEITQAVFHKKPKDWKRLGEADCGG